MSGGVIRLDDVEEDQEQPSSVSQLRLASRARASVLRSDWAQFSDDLTRLQRKAAGVAS